MEVLLEMTFSSSTRDFHTGEWKLFKRSPQTLIGSSDNGEYDVMQQMKQAELLHVGTVHQSGVSLMESHSLDEYIGRVLVW